MSEHNVSLEVISNKIYTLRNRKVMLDKDLALLYGVEVKVLNQSVRRNSERFPSDFMFQLSHEEYKNLKSQFVTSSWGGVRRANPYAFTEQGVAMLSSVLNSRRAIRVNIHIMRAFVQLRQMIGMHKELAEQLSRLEARVDKQDKHIAMIFEAIKKLMEPPPQPAKRPIGFHVKV